MMLWAFLLFATPALGADAEGATKRLFLLFLGEPGLKVEIAGETAGTSDEEGLLRFERPASPGEVLRFAVADPRWRLTAERVVPGGEASIPVYWDLASDLRRRSPVPPPSPSPPSPAPPSPSPPSPAAPPAPPPRPASIEGALDACQARRSLICQLEYWSLFNTMAREGDCDASLRAAERLMSEYPSFAATGETRRAFARVYFGCGLVVSGSLRQTRLSRALELLPAGDAEPAVTLEWEFYLRLQDGDLDGAAELAARAPRRLRLFLAAWLARARGECPSAAVELDSSGDLPCRGLPQDLCAPPYADYLLACGESASDAATAALFLRSALPADPQAWNWQLDGERDIIRLLAEAEHKAGRLDEAARLFAELAGFAADDREKDLLEKRRAEALLLLSEADPGAGDTARRALEAWESRLARLDDGTDRAIALNNLAVLRARLNRGPAVAELTELEAAIAELPESAAELRLHLRGHFLALSIAYLERSPSGDARDELERLRALREAFVKHEAALRATPSPIDRAGWVIAVPTGSSSLAEATESLP